MNFTPLPIDDALPALRDALSAERGAVLQAPPGAGKTTRVPLALLHERWLGSLKILMLEPRRLAARAAAHRMAFTLGERVGETVGYRVRLDSRVGPRTRIEVVTEGILTRMLVDDPTLDDYGIVIFDEFHERSLHADLGLALALETQRLVRDDLRLLVMSATITGAPVAALLGGVRIITSEGRAFPVETRHIERNADIRLAGAVVSAVRRALAEENGDILVFLPGAGEIRRVQDDLERGPLPAGTYVAPLHGSLPFEAQDLAIAPSVPERRKIVLATTIAETSLTIDGVRVVIDGGYARSPRFSPRSGMSRLETVRVSRASAEQRRGRAGRVEPGVCYRLWGEHEQAQLLPFTSPEILAADLAPLALDLAVAGIRNAGELAWLDAPPPAALSQARELLLQLGAIDSSGSATAHGRLLVAIGAHPRLAHMLLRAADEGLGSLGCDLAALLGARDVVRGDTRFMDADLRLRLDIVRDGKYSPGGSGVAGGTVDREAVRRVRAESSQWQRQLGISGGAYDADQCGRILALAYPDRVAQRRAGSAARYIMRNAGGAAFGDGQPLSTAPFLVVAETDGRRPESRILLAAPIDAAEVEAELADQIETVTEVLWDADAGAVRARKVERLGAIVLRDDAARNPDPDDMLAALLAGVRSSGLGALHWSEEAQRLRTRLAFVRTHDPAWPDVSDTTLLDTLDEWLAPIAHGIRRRDELRRLDLAQALEQRLTWEQRQRLEELAPTHLVVPSGSRVPVDYNDPVAPVLAVRLQELFGLTDTPRVMRGAVPLTLHLLSPARRLVQVTRDLAGFWRTSYFDVRKDLKGRYPKHHWPDDPLSAQATSRTKPRGS